jgi:putative cell wall-binding protein
MGGSTGSAVKLGAFEARPLVAALLSILLSLSLVLAFPSPASAATYPILDAPVDPYSNAAPMVCSNGYVYPGIYAFRDILTSSYGARTASLARNCPASGSSFMSYHARGLALDWRLNAYNSTEAAQAQQIMDWLFEPNSEGENQVRLRRLGIVEIIWSGKLWVRWDETSTSDLSTWRAYDSTSCVAAGGNPETCAHRDHIHFSFSLEGGSMQRSWWTNELAPYRDTPTSGPIPYRDLDLDVSRIGGETRYDVAVGISQEYFPDGADTVYIATGANFPDALGAAPAAALRDAPLLLVEPGSVPAGVQAELARLNPDQIIVAGGPASVSPDVLTQLGNFATSVTRIDGPDRYEVSRSVTRDAFGDIGSDVAYIATGATFPDALSASAAAGSLDAPVILLYGQASTLDPATAQLLTDLGVTDIRIAGGPASVSPGIEAALGNVPGVTSVTRLTGADRFVVSGATNRAAFSTSDIVFIASGYTFPDALAGAAVAGASGAPLYVVPTSCIPGYVLDDFESLGATRMQIFGGPGSVSEAAAALAQC